MRTLKVPKYEDLPRRRNDKLANSSTDTPFAGEFKPLARALDLTAAKIADEFGVENSTIGRNLASNSPRIATAGQFISHIAAAMPSGLRQKAQDLLWLAWSETTGKAVPELSWPDIGRAWLSELDENRPYLYGDGPAEIDKLIAGPVRDGSQPLGDGSRVIIETYRDRIRRDIYAHFNISLNSLPQPARFVSRCRIFGFDIQPWISGPDKSVLAMVWLSINSQLREKAVTDVLNCLRHHLKSANRYIPAMDEELLEQQKELGELRVAWRARSSQDHTRKEQL